jgi:hypothetical protein
MLTLRRAGAYSGSDPVAAAPWKWHGVAMAGARRVPVWGALLTLLTAFVYVSRPWSCTRALGGFGERDPVPYAQFDGHGVIVLTAWLLALVFAIPLLHLAQRVFMHGNARPTLFAQADDPRVTKTSVIISLFIGAPMYSQVAYLLALPLSITKPVLISSIAWLLVVELGRSAAVRNPDVLRKRGVRAVALLAGLIAVPKFLLMMPLFVRALYGS